MQKRIGLFLIFIIYVAAILVTGCTSSGSSPAPVTTTAAAVITITGVPVQTATPIQAVTTIVAVITTTSMSLSPTTDPILHRWVRQYINKTNGEKDGYEFKFYPEGTMSYKHFPNIEASGTWTKLGNNTYLVKFLPTGVSGAYIIREYTLVPAHVDPAYPGITIPEHIESRFEGNSTVIHRNTADQMDYPERAKID